MLSYQNFSAFFGLTFSEKFDTVGSAMQEENKTVNLTAQMEIEAGKAYINLRKSKTSNHSVFFQEWELELRGEDKKNWTERWAIQLVAEPKNPIPREFEEAADHLFKVTMEQVAKQKWNALKDYPNAFVAFAMLMHEWSRPIGDFAPRVKIAPCLLREPEKLRKIRSKAGRLWTLPYAKVPQDIVFDTPQQPLSNH